ncbi:MAG: hypothetical protein ACRDWY_12885 [Actinomycetes bacterium]
MTGRRDVFERIPGLVELREAQAGVCLRSQLGRLGVNSEDVACHVDNLRWQTVGPLLVVLHGGPFPQAARRWAVLLNAGRGAALGAWTALDEWGLRGWQREPTHVVVARGADPPLLPPELVGVVAVHESRRHTAQDVRRKGGLRLHSVERSAVDAATWSRSGRTACGVLAATVQQRLTTADRLLAELDVVGRVWGRRLMRGAVADIAGGSEALSEIDFVRFCRHRGLPEPVRQSVRRDAAGRRRYLDVEWRLPDGRSLIVEIDGVGHVDVDRWYEDLLRTAELVAGGSAEPLRLPALAVRLEPDRIERILRILLGLVRS